MTKTSFLKFAILAALAAGVLQAQTTVATVPFGFQVGTLALPPGQYRFAASDRVLEVHSLNATMPVAYAHTVAASRSPDPPRPAAVEFRRLANRYYLSAVWTDAANGFTLQQCLSLIQPHGRTSQPNLT